MNKIRKIRDTLDTHPKFKPSQHNSSKSFANFTELVKDEVEKIMSMSTKSCTLDILPTKVLKDIIKPLLPLPKKIINLSLTEGLFVEEWKVSIIHPLLKKLGLDLISKNYRPVSNLPFLSKVVEKSALKQFIKHCDDNSLCPTYQSAYRKNYSCNTALVKLFDDQMCLMEQQKVNLLVAIDLPAAFDMVDHGILIDVLDIAFNVWGKSLDWFNSYLYPRSCKVNIGESLCGPVLYNAYASTMNTVVQPAIVIHAYAEDHALRKEFNSSIPQEEVETAKSLSKSLDKIKDWINSCHLKMNSDKTEVILLG